MNGLIGILILIISIGIAFYAYRSRISYRPRCPWPLCNVELPKTPIISGIQTNSWNQTFYTVVPEKCLGCDEWVAWDISKHVFVRWKI